MYACYSRAGFYVLCVIRINFINFFFFFFYFNTKTLHWCNTKEVPPSTKDRFPAIPAFVSLEALPVRSFQVLGAGTSLLLLSINENSMTVLGSSKTHPFLGTAMKYNKMQMLSDREHR